MPCMAGIDEESAMLELRHLRTLSALRSAGSLVRAAQLLNLTQSALSHQIKLMEDRFQSPLFQRKSTPIAFTAAGSRLLELADSVLPRIDQAERDVSRLAQTDCGQLRVALECHSCFDWLMPVMDAFRQRWPEVEIDLVSGFHNDPERLLRDGQADLVIGAAGGADCVVFPLFRYETLAVLAPRHRLQAQRRLGAQDFIGETLIGYPLPEARVDLIREVLAPAGISVQRRAAELTLAILQLVASRRGVAALPGWVVARAGGESVITRPIGPQGLWSELHASAAPALAATAYVADFVGMIRSHCAARLDGIVLLG